jgi:hypothetical protein
LLHGVEGMLVTITSQLQPEHNLPPANAVFDRSASMYSSSTATPSVQHNLETGAWCARVLWKPTCKQFIGSSTMLDNVGSHALTAYGQLDFHQNVTPVMVPPLQWTTERFQLLQLWLGVVQEVTDNGGLAVTLIDQTDHHYPDEEVTISLADIPEQDRPLIMQGAVLYWSISYREDQDQPRECVSRIRVRRLPTWSEGDLARSRAHAQQIIADLK